ncbi:MAG: hypothetical protein LBM77_11830 [Spirochaetaceae bacterium]|jgi:hypothetical protein|nr:hypothetical protein [Spirochaetaceae bacterium]
MKRFLTMVILALMLFQTSVWAQDTSNAGNTEQTEASPVTAPSEQAKSGEQKDALPADSELQQAISNGNADQLYKWTVMKGRGQSYDEFRSKAAAALNWYTGLDRTPDAYRNGKMNSKVREVPVTLSSQVFTDPEAMLPEVVNVLLAKNNNIFEKTKILHDWICDNITYDADMLFSGNITNQDYISVLKKKMGVCSGFSNLMKQMCDLAGIEAKVINGCLKDAAYGYDPAKGAQTNHAWNSVKLGEKWYLVDCTLDQGYLDEKTAIKKYNTDYLFLNSRAFLYSHFAEKAEEQYYGPALTADTFVAEVFIPGAFFRYGLMLATNKPLYTNTIFNDVFIFDMMTSNNNITVTNTISPSTGNSDEAWVLKRSGAGASLITAGYLLPDENTAQQNDQQSEQGQTANSAQSNSSGEYTCSLSARVKDSVSYKWKVSSSEYKDWSDKIKALKDDGEITIYELSIFKSAYYKVGANDAYYFLDDQFATERNNTVLRIYNLLGVSTDEGEEILSFTMKDGMNQV